LFSDALVDDLEIVRKPHQSRALAYDVVRQAVQCAHAVSQVRQQPAGLDELCHPLREVVDGRVDQGDDQHFLVVVQPAAGDQPGRQRRQRLGLAAAGHG